MCQMLLLLTWKIFLIEVHVFLQLSWIGLFETHTSISTFKHLCIRKYSFQDLNKFSQRNRVLYVGVSNIHDFVWRDTCVSSTQQSSPIWSNVSCNPPWKPWFARSILLKKELKSYRKEWARCCSFLQTGGFLMGHACVSFTYLKRHNWNKMKCSPPCILWWEVYSFKN
jgi:hypothetical protein